MDFKQEKYATGAADCDERVRNLFPFYETIDTAINALLRGFLGPESELLIVGAEKYWNLAKLIRVGVF